jgi:hypothetical protein
LAPLGMSDRTQQVTEEKHRKTSEKLCPSSGNYPIRPVSICSMASTCLDKPILRSIIHHHPLIPCLVPQFHHFHFLLLPGGPDSNGFQGSQDFCCARSARCP